MDETVTHDPSAKLSFSEDSVFFDTLFTTLGSVTKRLVVYNPNKEQVVVSSISLVGNPTPYEIIVNGRPGPNVQNISIRGKDSIYVLVKVTIDPGNQNNSFLVSDTIRFLTNANQQNVPLIAYGQDAYFHSKETITCGDVWAADKPHVLYDTSVVQAGCTLTVQAGAKIYGHYQSLLKINGTLIVEGNTSDSVVFTSDQPNPDKSAGLWGGLYFTSTSTNNQLERTSILHTQNGILIEGNSDADSIADIKLYQCRILFCTQNIIQSSGADVHAENCLLGQSPKSVLSIQNGDAVFIHCTIENFSLNFFRTENLVFGSNSKCYFINSIVYGDMSEEFEYGVGLTLYGINSIIRTGQSYNNTNSQNINPNFVSISALNFQLKSNSAGIDAGSSLYNPGFDLIYKSRNNPPDIGCFEE
ncbi:MAG: hypothetical protein U0U66_11405 [Cytophagaceae bacterium]